MTDMGEDMGETADITPADDARVRAALRPLADVTMPPDVADRIDQVLRNEAADLTRRVASASEDSSAREQASASDSLRRRQQVMVGALATFIVIVIAGIVVSSHHAAPGGASASAGASAITSGTSITKSGRSWSPGDLQQSLHQTLAGAPSSQVPQSLAGSSRPRSAAGVTTAPSAGTAINGPGAAAGLPAATESDAQLVQTLISDPQARQACIDSLKETGDAHLLAVDAGTYDGSPAVTFVFPSSAIANHVDVYVVGPHCSATESNVLLFDRLPRP